MKTCDNKTTWSQSPMTSSSESRDMTSSRSRDMVGNSGGGASLHGSVTVSIIHNIDAAGLYNQAKGEIKLTFSSTLGAGGTSNGVERSVKVQSSETPYSTTTSQANLGDPDDIVSEFLGQINHAAEAAGEPCLVADISGYDHGPCQQRRSLSGFHQVPNIASERYVNGGTRPASFICEPDSKLHSYDVDGELLPAGLNGTRANDTRGGPAAETLKKMAALHRRLEEKTGSGLTDQLLSTCDHDHNFGGSRPAPYAVPYQLPVSFSTGNSRCGMVYGTGASKPLSHYPATEVNCTPAVAFQQDKHQTPEPDVAGSSGDTGSSFYMSQSQCVDFRLFHPGVTTRALMSQSATVNSVSPYRPHTSAADWTRVGCRCPQPRYPSADVPTGWISSPYCRMERRNPSASMTGNGSENQSRVFHGYRGNQKQSYIAGLQPPPYSDFLHQKQRLQFGRKCCPPTVESRWRRRPCNRHHDFLPTADAGVTPAPTPASRHVTFTDVEFPVVDEPLCQEFFFDACSSSNVALDNTDLSFIDDMFGGP